MSSSSYHCHDLINHHHHPHFITIIFLASYRHESGNAREATDKYRGNYKLSIDMKTKILCIFVFLSGCCFIALLHSCFPHVWLFVTSCTFTFLSCICCFAFPLFCCVIIVFDFIFKCFIMFFIVFYSYSCDSSFIRYRIFLTTFPGSFFRVRWINSYQNKKKCMNCLEIYWGLHVLIVALPAYKTFLSYTC